MRTRWAAIVAVLLAGRAAAQDRPVELPPLLTPSAPATPPPVPRGPGGEYDHGHLYLPESAPPPVAALPPEEVRPLGRWWVNPSLEIGWASEAPPLPTIRLRVPVVRNGPVVPLEGVSSDAFRLGFDVTGGYWLDDARRNAIDAGFYFLASSYRTVTGVAPGVLFVFPNGPSRSAPQLLAVPDPVADTFSGTFPVTHASWFASADVNYRRRLVDAPSVRLDALVGYRFGYVADEVYVGDVAEDNKDQLDRNRVTVSNQFHGGQVGLSGAVKSGSWSVGGTAKVALGAARSDVTETGLFTTPEVQTAGRFGPAAGLGGGSRFAVYPTLTTTVGRQFGDNCRVVVGYSFHYLNRVARLGDALAAAGTEVRHTDFWAQTVKLGLEVRY